MKRTYLNIPALALAGLITVGGTVGCKKAFDFTGADDNPYIATQPVTRNLLTQAIRSVPSTVNDATGALYAQHLAEVQYTDASRFITVNFSYAGFYQGPLLNLETIIKLNSDPATASSANVLSGGSNANQIAAARILKAFFFFHITNRWGDIPYTEALKQGGNLTPKFDTQQEVYNALFKELKEASAQFDGGATLQGDILFSGNVTRWRQFANSLRLIMALRLSKADAAKGKAEFIEAQTAAGGLVTTSAQNINYAFLSETANQNQWYARYLTRFDYAISKPLLDYMESVADPRIPAFADKPTNGNANYVGMPYGLSNTSGIANNSVSYIATNLRRINSPEFIITAAHVLFTLAEGEKLGWNAAGTADETKAANYYRQAIEQSMRQYGVFTQAAYDDYMTKAEVAYTAADALRKIGYQRWIALYLNGMEAWNEWRRTGFPVLSPGPAPLNNGGQIPRRQGYATAERDLNGSNYQAVVARQGPDELNTRIWIDK
ncbi:MAG TPA: SusD/RagB family nutrient-binding outer membrane lipoprotein [Phnomibacter sp.]|nr:SusD/RagB family nutrient-binding outer membrane lipoprotein [Phnomibacter sp.]